MLPLRGQSSNEGKRLFEQETFAGNGRTCLTCHSRETGTLSPQEAQRRFAKNRHEPLFLHDGSDDGRGNGFRRILTEGTIRIEIPLPKNVSLADDPNARSVVVRRGIPSTLNTPALDPVLMLDGREPTLLTQAASAIRDHAQSTRFVSDDELRKIAEFQKTDSFFTSPVLKNFARGGPAPQLPLGNTESEKRGRKFFEDVPQVPGSNAGTCAVCHSGPMLDRTNQFLPLPVPVGSRFQSVFVSELNAANNPVREFIFRNPDGTKTVVKSPDPGRALITGDSRNFPFDNLNAFKIPALRGVRLTAPYFHDNSARTLEDVMVHYARFFKLISDPAAPLILTPQDQADVIAYMKLLD